MASRMFSHYAFRWARIVQCAYIQAHRPSSLAYDFCFHFISMFQFRCWPQSTIQHSFFVVDSQKNFFIFADSLTNVGIKSENVIFEIVMWQRMFVAVGMLWSGHSKARRAPPQFGSFGAYKSSDGSSTQCSIWSRTILGWRSGQNIRSIDTRRESTTSRVSTSNTYTHIVTVYLPIYQFSFHLDFSLSE